MTFLVLVYFKNKDAKATMQSTTEQKLQFFKSIMDLKNDKMSSEEFVHSVTDEVLNNMLFDIRTYTFKIGVYIIV